MVGRRTKGLLIESIKICACLIVLGNFLSGGESEWRVYEYGEIIGGGAGARGPCHRGVQSG